MSTLLIIEDDDAVQQLIRIVLEGHGYQVMAASTGQEGVQLARANTPDLVLLDINLPDADGYQVARRLRGITRLVQVPIIMLTAKSTTADKLAGFAVGADDYVTKPFDIDELLARVQAQLRRVEQGLLSELTGLPGNTLIERAIHRTLERVECPWAILYVDLDNFKAFNDTYGFMAGNTLIKELARVLRAAVAELGHEPDLDFVGHIGGDDFVVITSAERAESICRAVIHRFDELVPAHYGEDDRRRGYVLTPNRQGRLQRFPLVSVSIGVVNNLHRAISDPLEVGSIAAEVKRKAKALPGSAYYVDRRAGPPATTRRGQ